MASNESVSIATLKQFLFAGYEKETPETNELGSLILSHDVIVEREVLINHPYMASKSVAAELRKLQKDWKDLADWMTPEEPASYQSGRIGQLRECMKALEPLIARLEAPDPALEELRKLVEKASTICTQHEPHYVWLLTEVKHLLEGK